MPGKRAGELFLLLFVGALVVPLSGSRAQVFRVPAVSTEGDHRPQRPFTGKAGRWVWLQQFSKQSTLFFQEGAGAGVQIASGSDWVEVALDGDAAWVLQRQGGRGALLRVPLRASSRPQEVRAGLADPGGLLAQEGRLYWLERRPGSSKAPAYIPAVGPMLQLMVREASGAVRALGVWPAGTEAISGPGAGDLLGVQDGALWARVRRLSSTELVRFPLSGGDPERVASEAGGQTGLVAGGEVYWTAPSAEGVSAGLVSVRRLHGSTPESVTDWLPGAGSLLAADGALYYAADRLYRLPARLAPSVPLREISSGRVETDGHSLLLVRDQGPEPLSLAGRTW
jgi:hypothetical protein